MSVIDKFKDLVGIEEEYDEDDFDAEEEEYGYDRKTVETRAPLSRDTAAATMWCRCRTVP